MIRDEMSAIHSIRNTILFSIRNTTWNSLDSFISLNSFERSNSVLNSVNEIH